MVHSDSTEITREYLDSLLIEMRHIDAVHPSTEFELFGEKFETPIMFAALSHLDKTHPGGMTEAAKGVKAAGAVMWAGMGTGEELERITATGARTVKIIKPYEDRADVLRRIEHAEKCGCLAVGMDIDHQFGGHGSWYQCAGFSMKPVTLDEIKSFVKATSLPFVIKGVLSEIDARKCVDAGVRGIVVSHHHGMVDYAVPPLFELPRIARAVGAYLSIFADCAFDRGIDVFKALALGANAAAFGRALMEPLRKEGAAGVEKYIREQTEDLRWTMAVTCSPDIRHIDSSVLVRK